MQSNDGLTLSEALSRRPSYTTTTSRLARTTPRPIRQARRHKRLSSAAYSTESLPSLPEYHFTPKGELVDQASTNTNGRTITDWEEDDNLSSPPPTYPGLSSPPPDDLVDEERDVVPAPIPSLKSANVKRLRRRKSVGGTNDRLDTLLERSVMALEASTALLQSSMSTHSSLSAVLEDSSFDRSIDVQIRYLARRLNAEGAQDNGLDKVLEEVVDFLRKEDAPEEGSVRNAGLSLEGGVSRSLPAEDHMQHLRRRSSRDASVITGSQRRLRLSDGPRPRSPPPRAFTQYVSIESPMGLALEATSDAESILMPSTSGFRTTLHEEPFSTSPRLPIVPPSPITPTLPVSKAPQAHAMLHRIHSRSSTPSRDASPETSRSYGVATIPKFATRFDAADTSKLPRGRGLGKVRNTPELVRTESDTSYTTASGTTKTWSGRSRSYSTDTEPTYSRHRLSDSTSSAPPHSSPSFADLHFTSSEEPPLSATWSGFSRFQVGDNPPPSASYKVSANLRKILAESEKQATEPLSEVAQGKQRATGERPSMIPTSTMKRSLSVGRKPPKLTALITPSPSMPEVVREASQYDGRTQQVSLLPPTPSTSSSIEHPSSTLSSTSSTPKRRSAMKGSSGRSTPLSSGQSSPRVVNFAPLPPKYESDGSVQRARSKSKTRKPKPDADAQEKKGWWTQWLLGAPPASDVGRGRTFIPVHTRTGSMLREEGRWNSGMESWQV